MAVGRRSSGTGPATPGTEVTRRVYQHPPRRAPKKPLRRHRSPVALVQTDIDVKSWMIAAPSVEAVRPACCPRCEQPSRPIGDRLILHGHGLRPRRLRGPLVPDGAADEVEIVLRRYLCRACGAVVAVGPAGVVPGRLYSAMAIALALWLYGVQAQSHPRVRRRVSPWPATGRDPARTLWVTLIRWVEARGQGRLFTRLRCPPPDTPRRQLAALTALALCALALTTASSPSARIFDGATRAG